MADNKALCEIKGLHTSFRIHDQYYDAVDNVSLELYPDEVLAIVGESGCGKSTLATSIMGLHDPNYTKVSGEIIYNGKNLIEFDEDQMNEIRGGEIAMIFQDPLSSLNPLQRIGQQIEEGMLYHTDLTAEERKARTLELLKQVGIDNPERTYRQFPHELSGGMRQWHLLANLAFLLPMSLQLHWT